MKYSYNTKQNLFYDIRFQDLKKKTFLVIRKAPLYSYNPPLCYAITCPVIAWVGDTIAAPVFQEFGVQNLKISEIENFALVAL